MAQEQQNRRPAGTRAGADPTKKAATTTTTRGASTASTTTRSKSTSTTTRSSAERNAAMKGAIAKGKESAQKPPVKRDSGISKTTKRNIYIITIIVIAAVCTYAIVACVEYILGWKQDQSALVGAVTGAETVVNDAGTVGAKLAHLLVSEWFGIFGLLIPLAVILMSFFLVYRKNMLFIKVALSMTTGTIIWSSAATLVSTDLGAIFGTSLGGGFGLMFTKYLNNYFGNVGCVLLIIVTAFIWTIYTFPKSFILFEGIYKVIISIITTIFVGKSKGNKEPSAAVVAEIKKEDEIVKDIIKEEKVKEDLEPINAPVVDKPKKSFDDIPFTIGNSESVTVEPKSEDKSTDDVPFTFNIPTADEQERQGTHSSDINPSEFEIVVGRDVEVVQSENSDSKIIEVDSEALNPDEIDQTLFDPTLELANYQLPPFELLEDRQSGAKITEAEIHENKERILNTLQNFSIAIKSIRATVGPTVTLYEIVPEDGVRISKIKNLEDDIALSLSALGIRIIAPMPGKGTIGIEVPNKNKEVVSMYTAITSSTFQDSDAELPIVLGKTIQDHNFVLDLAKMPHMLVAGATGQGKSVGLNAIITSLLYKKHPSELKFVMIDPKKVELSLYTLLENHFLAKMEDEPESIITDTQRVIYTLNSLCMEMDDRYELLKTARAKNIIEYNNKFRNRRLNPNKGHRFMPYIVVVIDEFADLIMTAGKEIETPIARIAQLARAVGIHLIIATQRPAANVITGVIKANFPARIAFRVMTSIDSKIILDSTGANQLIGRGDMLVSVGGEVTRVQCAFVDTPEIERIADFVGDQAGFGSPMILPDYVPESASKGDEAGAILSKRDALFDEIARYVVTNQQGSASTIQRNFSIGFNRAGRIMDQLEKAGIVGKQQGSKPREVRIMDLSSLELLLYDLDNNPFNAD